MNPPLAPIAEHLRKQHGCHTVILYGSRASGAASADSDCDVIGFREGPGEARDVAEIDGVSLDAFIYPDSSASPRDLLRIHGGQVLLEKGDFGTSLLNDVATVFRKGPEKLTARDAEARRAWHRKMLKRIGRGGVEANYRRVWLLTELLHDYFALRGLWTLGPKKDFAWMSDNDPETLEAFQVALSPGASIAAISVLVDRVSSG